MPAIHTVRVLIAYDVASNRVRTRIRRILLRFGTPIQLSVFECVITRQGLEELRSLLDAELGRHDGSLFILALCGRCEGGIRDLGTRGDDPRRDLFVL